MSQFSDSSPIRTGRVEKSSLMESINLDDSENHDVSNGLTGRVQIVSKNLFGSPEFGVSSIPTSSLNVFLFDSSADEKDTNDDEYNLLDDSAERLLADLEQDDGDIEVEGTHSIINNVEQQVDGHTLTDSALKRKEEEESEQLAWELMRQEQEELYNMQVQFIQNQAGTMSEEDYRALQSILNENPPQQEDEHSVDSSQEEDETDDWDYDRLLALGQALGDVKTERWRLRSKSVIESLPVKSYAEVLEEVSCNRSPVDDVDIFLDQIIVRTDHNLQRRVGLSLCCLHGKF
jgi:hypothetical protein